MAKTQFTTGFSAIFNAATTTTYLFPIGMGATTPISTGEDFNTETFFGFACTISNLSVRAASNTRTTSSILKSKYNFGDGVLTVTIAGSTSGEFRDVTNSDSVGFSGDGYGFQLDVTGAGNLALVNLNLLVDSTTSTYYCIFINNASSLTNATTRFSSISGGGTTISPPFYIVKMQDGGSFRRLGTAVITNTLTGATTFFIANNGVNLTNTLTFSATNTGTVNDGSHTDNTVSGNTISVKITSLGTGVISFRWITVEYLSTTKTWYFVSYVPSGQFSLSNTTPFYTHIAGDTGFMGSTTESTIQSRALLGFTASNLTCYISSNAAAAINTCKLRKNAGATGCSVNITASTTGLFEDTTGSETIAANDLLSQQFVNNTTSLMQCKAVYMRAIEGSAAPTLSIPVVYHHFQEQGIA